MKKNKQFLKEVILITSSFIMGGIVMLLILRFTPILNSNLVITKNETEVYEKSTLAASVSKIYDAVVVVQAYKG